MLIVGGMSPRKTISHAGATSRQASGRIVSSGLTHPEACRGRCFFALSIGPACEQMAKRELPREGSNRDADCGHSDA